MLYVKSVLFLITVPEVPLNVATALSVAELGPDTKVPVVFGNVMVMSLAEAFEVAIIVEPVEDPLSFRVALVPLKFN